MAWGKCATCLADLPEPVKACRCGSRRIVEMGEKREPRGKRFAEITPPKPNRADIAGAKGGRATQERRRETLRQAVDFERLQAATFEAGGQDG